MLEQIETVRRYIEDQRSIVLHQHDVIGKYNRLAHVLAFALETETGMAAEEWIAWAQDKIAEMDAEQK